MKQRFDPVSSQILYGIEKSTVYRMHIDKVNRTKAAIDVSPPNISARHRMIKERQERERRKYMGQKKKNKRYIYERDIENNPTILSIPQRLEILNSTLKSSDSRKKVKDYTEKPVFSTVTRNFDIEYDSFEDENSSQMDESEIFIPQDYSIYAKSARTVSSTQSPMTSRTVSSMKTGRSLTGSENFDNKTEPNPHATREAVLSRIDYSIIPGMHIIDEILKVELSDDSSTTSDDDVDYHTTTIH